MLAHTRPSRHDAHGNPNIPRTPRNRPVPWQLNLLREHGSDFLLSQNDFLDRILSVLETVGFVVGVGGEEEFWFDLSQRTKRFMITDMENRRNLHRSPTRSSCWNF